MSSREKFAFVDVVNVTDRAGRVIGLRGSIVDARSRKRVTETRLYRGRTMRSYRFALKAGERAAGTLGMSPTTRAEWYGPR